MPGRWLLCWLVMAGTILTGAGNAAAQSSSGATTGPADVAAPTDGARPSLQEQTPMPPPVVEGSGVPCNADAVQRAIGRKPTRRVTAWIKRESGAGSVRVIPADAGATRDFRPDRINLELDRAGRIRSIRCG